MKEVVYLSELEKIARLSKLGFSAEELQSFLRDINDIVAHFEKLNQLDLQDVSSTSHLGGGEPPFFSDEPQAWEGSEEVLKGAPWVAGGYFIVPRIVDKEEKENEVRRI